MKALKHVSSQTEQERKFSLQTTLLSTFFTEAYFLTGGKHF